MNIAFIDEQSCTWRDMETQAKRINTLMCLGLLWVVWQHNQKDPTLFMCLGLLWNKVSNVPYKPAKKEKKKRLKQNNKDLTLGIFTTKNIELNC